ncbi:MAG: pyridoxal 5'-phosphate synthase glutaminase subunit PdxT, partial [Nocardioides sp.]
MSTTPTIGVLAVQGDVREHVRMLSGLGVAAITVRRTSELDACDGLVIPGGESTTMAKLARTFDLFEPIRQRIKEGLPAFGTCAGMIMLADRIEDGAADQETLGGLDITVRRNAFGRQVDSFEGDVDVDGLVEPVHAIFIRAPWVESVGSDVEVLA